MIREIASDRWAWTQTKGRASFINGSHPIDETSWATAGTANAISRAHLDDAGFVTTTQILTGKKYWVVFDRDHELPDGDPRGDFGSTSWSPALNDAFYHKFDGYLRAEAIEMVPGTLLLVYFAFTILLSC